MSVADIRPKWPDILSTFLANNALILVADTGATLAADTMPIFVANAGARLTLTVGPSLSFRLAANRVSGLPQYQKAIVNICIAIETRYLIADFRLCRVGFLEIGTSRES